ncbi:hypothetical protein [Streptacidiphilus jiangxiensis]|uniref:Uncharacterized protein n=1 Tax=Streptacidiphilus jiangxiensis TaxID=235985 RepID=A0A1H7ZEJ4_STRJI|nr:hypothetical protein [Streptacidiphilus jiangxiensis]SEM55958.1 hypothetical protein SAMN05414137_13424 [Streptacidiphilus jiangxiensis]
MAVHMALTGNAEAVRAVVAAVAGSFTTTERQVPKAPGMLHTRIYDVDAASGGTDRPGKALAPAGSGSVHVTLTGDAEDTGRLTRWIAGTFRSEGPSVSAEGRMSFDVHADEASPGG